MKLYPEHIYHIYNQGNNKEQIFLDEAHYEHFISLYKNYIFSNCNTLGWCLMPNHFHFMIHIDERCTATVQQGGLLLDPVTNGFRKMLSSYAHQFNIKHNRSGSLFRQKTKYKDLIDDASNAGQLTAPYALNCLGYIHENPVVAGLVKNSTDWKWSSASSYLNQTADLLCNKELIKMYFG